MITIESVRKHFDSIANDYDTWKEKNSYYYDSIKAFVKRFIPPDKSVLDIGCATGEILACTQPKRGVGIDISAALVAIAKEKYPHYTFLCSSAEDFQPKEKFDYIIMVDVVEHADDLINLFESVHGFCHATTKIVLTTTNSWWEPVRSFMEKIGAKMPEGPHNFVEKKYLTKLLESLDFSEIYSGYMLLFPRYIPVVSFLANTVGVKMWGLNKFSFVHCMAFRAFPRNNNDLGLGCSVVIPCYNNAGTIEAAVKRMPAMGKKTEIILVNDGSTDDTQAVAHNLLRTHPSLIVIDESIHRGKAYAVKRGLDVATQDVLMVFDTDMSVEPEELPRFFTLLNKGIADFVKGTRMVYPMGQQAMHHWNLFGNKVFALFMAFITGQYITDTFCGTRAFYRKDYQDIREVFGRGEDYDFLFAAAKRGLQIREVPVHHESRTPAQSMMEYLREGLCLLGACARGFRSLILTLEIPKRGLFRNKKDVRSAMRRASVPRA